MREQLINIHAYSSKAVFAVNRRIRMATKKIGQFKEQFSKPVFQQLKIRSTSVSTTLKALFGLYR